MLVQERKTARSMRFSMRQRRMLVGYLFISPVVLGYLIWVAGPMMIAIWLSLTDWDLLRPPHFVGLENYRTMFQDDLFWKSLKVTFYFTLVSVPLSLALSFAVACAFELLHLLLGLEWFGTMAPLAVYGTSLRPITWGPPSHVLPLGIACSMPCAPSHRVIKKRFRPPRKLFVRIQN